MTWPTHAEQGWLISHARFHPVWIKVELFEPVRPGDAKRQTPCRRSDPRHRRGSGRPEALWRAAHCRAGDAFAFEMHFQGRIFVSHAAVLEAPLFCCRPTEKPATFRRMWTAPNIARWFIGSKTEGRAMMIGMYSQDDGMPEVGVLAGGRDHPYGSSIQ